MLRDFFARGVLYWLRAPKDYEDLQNDEWMLATTRLLLGIACLTAIFRLQGGEPNLMFAALTFFFLAYSLGIMLFLRLRSNASAASHIWIQCADLLWLTHLVLFIHWPAMEFAIFFFLVASAGVRWGFWETQLNATALFVLVAAGCSFYGISLRQFLNYQRPLDLIPSVLIYVAESLTIGVLAEAKSVRTHQFQITQMIEGLSHESGMEPALRLCCMKGMQLYGATQVLVAMHQTKKDETLLFRMSGPRAEFQTAVIPKSERPLYFFPTDADTLRLSNRSQRGDRFHCHLLQDGKFRKELSRGGVPDAFIAAYPFHSMFFISVNIGDVLSGRIFLLDPLPMFGGNVGLHYLHRAIGQAAPAIYDMFLVDRVKSKVEADMSVRVARELHDGVIQTLCSVSMQLESLRSRDDITFRNGDDPLARIQEIVEKEIAEMREFMDHLRSLEVDSNRLIGYLAGLTMKFQIQHGIDTRFVSDVEDVRLQPRVCVELARIVQEALVNVRKHSRASEVFVRFGARNGGWVLSITDNGRGFGFSGRLSHEELLASGRGPTVIMDRARTISGRVSIESEENGGSIVEITIPREAVA